VVGNSRGCRSEEGPVKDGQILTKPVCLRAFLSNNFEMPHENRNSPRLYPDLVPPLSAVYNSMIEVNDKMMGFDSMIRRKSPLNEGFTGNPGDSDPMF
jgi:hypothetical protein